MASNMHSQGEINVLTINCWGLKYLAKFRRERLAEIGRQIATADPIPHIVGLQECWTQEDYLAIRRVTREILPYGKFYHSGIFGGGLAILSKWTIEESSMFRYPLNGRPTAFFRGDWFVGKGVAAARIRYGPQTKDIVEVFTTHLHAPYEAEPNDSYICHRTAQAWEIAKLMRGAAERGHLVIGLGDFNMVPLSLAHRLISTHSPARDVWLLLHPESSIGAALDPAEKARLRPIPTAGYNVTENGATCDSVLNTWRWDKKKQRRLGPGFPTVEVPFTSLDPRAKRLDYIFASTGYDTLNPENGAWFVKSAKLGMMSRHPELQCSLSDHFSVEAILVHSKLKMEGSSKGESGNAMENGAFLESPVTSEFASKIHLGLTADRNTSNYLPVEVYEDILAMIEQYRLRERRQRRLRLGHFMVSIFVCVGCHLAIWWSPKKYVSFLLTLISTFGLSSGVIDGLIGGLFVGSEIRALKEFEWEISNARSAAAGEPHTLAEEGIIDW